MRMPYSLLAVGLGMCLSAPVEASSARVLVPIVLSSGGAKGSFYTSEMALTNKGSTVATLDFTYTPAFGGGEGSASDTLPAGAQQIVPDAISYLRSLGVPIPEGVGCGGTLGVEVSGASASDVSITVRTTTQVPEGRAGLAYSAISAGLTGPGYLCGLRQNATDRANVAVLNGGAAGSGDVVLRLTLCSGDSSLKTTLPDETLPPGGFKQFSSVFAGTGITNGYVRVERVSGTAPYYAYAVINDQANSDGSFVPPVAATANTSRKSLVLPVAVESGPFTTELVVTNFSSVLKTLSSSYVADNVGTVDNTATFSVSLGPGTQVIIPSLVQYLRDNGVAGIGPAGTSYAGALFTTVDTTDAQGIVIAARTSAAGGGGRYGLFYSATPEGEGIDGDAWVYGLRQDGENRTNLAFVNTGEDASTDVFTVELFDGTTGVLAGRLEGVSVAPKRWTQIGTILAQAPGGTKQAYARITRTAGANPYLAYAVINDGSGPGQRSGDGAFLPAERESSPTSDKSSSAQVVNNSGGRIDHVNVGNVTFSDNLSYNVGLYSTDNGSYCGDGCSTGFLEVAEGTDAITVSTTSTSGAVQVGFLGPLKKHTDYAVNVRKVGESYCAELWQRTDTSPTFNDDTTRVLISRGSCQSSTPSGNSPSAQIVNNSGDGLYKVTVGNVDFTENLGNCGVGCSTGFLGVAEGTDAITVSQTSTSGAVQVGLLGSFQKSTSYAVNVRKVSGSYCAELWRKPDTNTRFNDDTTRVRIGTTCP